MSSQRENRIPENPRFDFVTEKAYELLLEHGYSKFPISPFQVLDDLSEFVICLPWSKAREILDSPDPFHLREIKAEARSIRPGADGKYYIVYDNVRVNNEARISWTIMHEIGHIILGHLTDFKETALDRGGLTSQKYGVLEIEAHYFAAEFLMPTAVLKYLRGITEDEISLLFGVSEEASAKKYNRVFEADYLPHIKYEEKLIRNFYNFIIYESDEVIYNRIHRMRGTSRKERCALICRKCPGCFSYIREPEAKFCPYCGEPIEQQQMHKNMFAHSDRQKKRGNQSGVSHISYVHYVTGRTDSGRKEQRLAICPTCLNHSFSDCAKYCNICGEPLTNFCEKDGQQNPAWYCYCMSCGSELNANSWYRNYEERTRKINSYAGLCCDEDRLNYPYWEFVKYLVEKDYRSEARGLVSGLLYSTAFIDDNDDICIITDTEAAAQEIRRQSDIILKSLEKTDDIKRQTIEVTVVHDI